MLPADFLEELADREFTDKTRQSTTAKSKIEFYPHNVALSLRLFQELTFALYAPSTTQVELLWRTHEELSKVESVGNRRKAATALG